MRISDWSSNVCSSDLIGRADRWPGASRGGRARGIGNRHGERRSDPQHPGAAPRTTAAAHDHHLRGQRVAPSADRRLRPLRPAEDLRCSGMRSEEHTSELQSLMRISYAVFCLKKKKKRKHKNLQYTTTR